MNQLEFIQRVKEELEEKVFGTVTVTWDGNLIKVKIHALDGMEYFRSVYRRPDEPLHEYALKYTVNRFIKKYKEEVLKTHIRS